MDILIDNTHENNFTGDLLLVIFVNVRTVLLTKTFCINMYRSICLLDL